MSDRGARVPRDRAETEEAARTGEFEDATRRAGDDSNPVAGGAAGARDVDVGGERAAREPDERESYPIDAEQPGVVTGIHDWHGESRTDNPGQSSGTFDAGVDAESLRSPSQGARPEGLDDATRPGESDGGNA